MNSHFNFLKFISDNYTYIDYSDGSREWTDKKCKYVFSEEQIWEAWKKHRDSLKTKIKNHELP